MLSTPPPLLLPPSYLHPPPPHNASGPRSPPLPSPHLPPLPPPTGLPPSPPPSPAASSSSTDTGPEGLSLTLTWWDGVVRPLPLSRFSREETPDVLADSRSDVPSYADYIRYSIGGAALRSFAPSPSAVAQLVSGSGTIGTGGMASAFISGTKPQLTLAYEPPRQPTGSNASAAASSLVLSASGAGASLLECVASSHTAACPYAPSPFVVGGRRMLTTQGGQTCTYVQTQLKACAPPPPRAAAPRRPRLLSLALRFPAPPQALTAITVVASLPENCFDSDTCAQFRLTAFSPCDFTYSLVASSPAVALPVGQTAVPAASASWCAAAAAGAAAAWVPPSLLLRSADDPFYQTQERTDCTNWFGLTATELRSLGFILFVPGVAATACVWGLLLFVCCRFCASKNAVVDMATGLPVSSV